VKVIQLGFMANGKREQKPREPIPPYLRVAAAVRDDIKSRRLLPGNQVPSATELAAIHNVSRNTGARALRLLRDEGWIVTQRGWGSFVADNPPAG
jgi:DNA-binding GntR family transcriptional regulator